VRSADGGLIAATTVRTVLPVRGGGGVVAVAARMFSEGQLDQLRSFPGIGRDDLIRYFTLTQADVAFVDPGRGRGPAGPCRSALHAAMAGVRAG
jgi:hypothetical protein